ncbi:hypothetical protein ABPG72_015478 [Tetrahymena utriculariae]
MGQNISLNKNAILYEIAQGLIKKKIQKNIDTNSDSFHEIRADDLNRDNFILEIEILKEQVKQKSDEIEILRKELSIESILKNQLESMPLLDLKTDFQPACLLKDFYQDKSMQKLGQAAPNQENQLKPYHEKELNQQKNQKDKFEIKPKSQTQFDQKHSKETSDFQISFQEDSENSSQSDLKNSDGKDLAETSISSPNNTSSSIKILNSVTASSKGESDFWRILQIVKLQEQAKEISEAIIDTKNSKGTQKFHSTINHQQSQTDLKLKKISPTHNDYSQKNIQLTCMDFCVAKASIEDLKVVNQIDEDNFFSDEVVKYSSNKKSEKKIIVLNSLYFYVLSQEPEQKYKQFLIEDISKIVICPYNKQLCSLQIKKQFQLIIEVPHIKFFIQHIQNHFKNILKKNSPKIKIQRTAIQTNNNQQSDLIAQKFLVQQRGKQEFNKNNSDQKNQLITDSAQLNFCSQINHYFKAFIVKNPNNLIKKISSENWVEGFLYLEKDESVSVAEELIFYRAAKLEVQAEVDYFINNQKIFKFSDKEGNHYLIKLKQDFDIPILNKNINCGYQQYFNLYNCLNS